jgi:hypothetical protein
MNSSLSDPNNHVPEVSPDDDWGDAEGSVPNSATPATILPPRRTVADRSAAASTPSSENDRAGLRIESGVRRADSPEVTSRLEVQELGSSVVRLDQMAPAPPKVPRQVTFHERPARDPGQKKDVESASWGITRQLPKLWVAGAGIFITAIIVGAMALLPSINARNRSKSDGRQVNPDVEEKLESVEALNLMLTKQPEALQIFHVYATANHADEVIPVIRNGKALEESFRSHWHPSGISKQWAPSTDSSWSLEKVAGHPCGKLEGFLPDQSKFTAYFTNDGNRLLLDWKATTAFGTATFSQLKKGEGDPAEVRGELSPGDFYSEAWPETDYQNYRFVSPDGDTIIWCYGRRGEPAEKAIAPLFEKGAIIEESQDSKKITLRLQRGPDGALPNQWLIGEMLHIDWLTP